MRHLRALLAGAATLAALGGCAVAQSYPAYRGTVLELGTDRPVELAGVLAVYSAEVPSVAGWHGRRLGYQAVLTDRDGRFEIPGKTFRASLPFGRFKPSPFVTIYKWGYGHFPGSFPRPHGPLREKYGRTEPRLAGVDLPPEVPVTFWLPKLETAEEIAEHNSSFPSRVAPDKGYPPPGMHDGLFRPPNYSGWDGPYEEQYRKHNEQLRKSREEGK